MRRLSIRAGFSLVFPAGDGGDDRDLSSLAHLGLQPVEKTNVLAVDIDVDKPPQLAVFFAQSCLDSGVFRFELIEHFANGCALDLDQLDVARKFSQGRRNNHCLGHYESPSEIYNFY